MAEIQSIQSVRYKKTNDATISEPIPITVSEQNVVMEDGTKLKDILDKFCYWQSKSQ